MDEQDEKEDKEGQGRANDRKKPSIIAEKGSRGIAFPFSLANIAYYPEGGP